MKVSLANALGTCFGVEDAITMAMTPEFGANLTIRRAIGPQSTNQ